MVDDDGDRRMAGWVDCLNGLAPSAAASATTLQDGHSTRKKAHRTATSSSSNDSSAKTRGIENHRKNKPDTVGVGAEEGDVWKMLPAFIS